MRWGAGAVQCRSAPGKGCQWHLCGRKEGSVCLCASACLLVVSYLLLLRMQQLGFVSFSASCPVSNPVALATNCRSVVRVVFQEGSSHCSVT
jgi:hypothetical protein